MTKGKVYLQNIIAVQIRMSKGPELKDIKKKLTRISRQKLINPYLEMLLINTLLSKIDRHQADKKIIGI